MLKIRDWDNNFETNDTRKLKRLLWVKFPNQHDSLPYRSIASHRRGPEIFTAWVLMVQVASKQSKRGHLSMSPEELSLVTGFPSEIFKLAIEFLKTPKINWIEQSPDTSGNSPDTSGFAPENPPVDGRKGMEGKEGKQWTSGPWFLHASFSEAWKAWSQGRKKKPGERQYRLLERLSRYDLGLAVKILEQSADRQWDGLFDLKGGTDGKNISDGRSARGRRLDDDAARFKRDLESGGLGENPIPAHGLISTTTGADE